MAWVKIFPNEVINTELVSSVQITNGDERLAAVLHMAGGNRVNVTVKDWPAVQKALRLPEQS